MSQQSTSTLSIMGVSVFERPDGFYWRDAETGKDYGPFVTLEAVEADIEYDPDSNYEPGETLAEAEEDYSDIDYWLSQPPAKRLEALELLRQIAYGYDPDTARLSGPVEVVKPARR